MEPRSGPKHLASEEHRKAVELAEDSRHRREDAQKEREAETAARNLRNSKFAAAPSVRGPAAAMGTSRGQPGLQEVEMWADFAANGAEFDAGGDTDAAAPIERWRDEARTFGILNPDKAVRDLGLGADDEVQMGGEDAEEDFLAELMATIGLDEPEPDQIAGHQNPASDSEWFPYPSRTMFLLDTLDNLPRLRISSSMMRVFLWVLKESGCKNVPSFDSLRRFQKKLRAEVGIPSIPCKSPFGNIFFMNDPRAIVAQDWSNPTTRKLIHVYPEIPEDGIIREIWHAQKWRKSMDLDFLSPMFAAGLSHHYVNEISRLKNGKFIIPIRWVKFRQRIYCDAYSITFNEKNEATIVDSETSLVCCDDLTDNYLALRDGNKIPTWSEETMAAGHPTRMPNLKREIAGGDPLYTSFVDYFGDDVSGNRTKSWNKHWNAYFTHRNLPRKLLQQEFHVHFVSTSPNASISEQFREFKSAVEETHSDPVRVEDENGSTTRFCIHVNAGPSDNPMQSEIVGHIGGKGNHFCRKCEVGGTQKEKAADEGYHALFEPGIPRTKEKIITELKKQVKLACAGVASKVKESQTQTGVKDIYTQHWIEDLIARFKELKQGEPTRTDADIQEELVQWALDNEDQIYSGFLTMKGFDPTKDTPVEILHTILLGIVKYIWHITHTTWTPTQKKTYSTRLQATATDGLSIHAIRANYIMQYAGSLIGRQLKTIAQTNVFHLHDIVSEEKFSAWKAAGELSALLWFPEIRNLAEYRADLKVAVANVLDIFSAIDPSKIITKIKYHLLTHIDDDAVGFGPLVGVATEIYECFNAIFRYCSILSNHLAPSRDIAAQLGDQEALKHRLTGGRWSCGENTGWKCAGSGVRQFLVAHPVLQKLLGWTDGKDLRPGAFKLAQLKRGHKERTQLALKATTASRALNFGDFDSESLWKSCISVVSESLDECLIGSWVFAKPDALNGDIKSGRISEVLVDNTGRVVAVLERFQVLSTRDEKFGMPVLVRRDGETTFSIVPAESLMFKFNAQHDCFTAKCTATGQRLRIQERVDSDTMENFIEHNPLDRFIINSHAFHNAHLLRATLPRELLAPIPLFDDRKGKHDELAAQLREKRAQPKGKRKHDEDEPPGPEKPAKRRKPTKKKKKLVAPPPVFVGLVAGRPKRVVTRSAKAIAADDDEEEDEDEEDSELDDGEPYEDSDNNYSSD
ncbi:hypothetical protein B0H16DRAFT_1798016 [Mycena metata]|uniref:Uncharacterized protein n=1 Tax=Mycena metata TaxID=1033252 RepID=A0AAD7JJK9_9AGAR|nr:hypothetical protein B0H16DRAFT_1798016 [Mycena metata]